MSKAEDDLQKLKAERDEALAERAALWDELNRRRADEQELAELRKTLDATLASTSWRITAPLRTAKALKHRTSTLAGRARRGLRQA